MLDVMTIADEKLRKAQAERLAEAREAAGYKRKRQASETEGWPESTYSAHERGTRAINPQDAEKYARAFTARGAKVTAEEILFPFRKREQQEVVEWTPGTKKKVVEASIMPDGELVPPRSVPPGVREIASNLAHVEVWRLTSEMIAGLGYRAGDYVVVDLDREPRPSDVVLVMRRDSTPAPIFRMFVPPWLYAAPPAGAAVPMPISFDGSQTIIRGVVVASVRSIQE